MTRDELGQLLAVLAAANINLHTKVAMSQPQCPNTAPDFVTVVTAADGKRMTKVFFVDNEGLPQSRSYDRGYLFNFATPAIGCLDDLARVLDGLDRHSCVIYGRLIDGVSTPCRRLLHADAKTGDAATIEDAAHHWILLDIDKLAIERAIFNPVEDPEHAADYVISKLPPEFQGARCLWRLTSSAGVKRSDTISMRLGFWLDRPLTGAEVKLWLTGTIADPAIYTPNQLIYAAKPVFTRGRSDPVPRRSGVVEAPVPIVTPGVIPERAVKIPRELKRGVAVEQRAAPEGVVFDAEAAIAIGREAIQRALACDDWNRAGEAPTPTGARAYKLAALLKDEALSRKKIVELLIEMVPWFRAKDRPHLEAMVESAFLRGQNDPGCGSANSIVRLFETAQEQLQEQTEGLQDFWNRIIDDSHGAVQRIPEPPATWAFSAEFTEETRRKIEEGRAELARRLRA